VGAKVQEAGAEENFFLDGKTEQERTEESG